MNFKIINLIGYSGSGKTFFIANAIKLLKKNLNYNVAVIKNVKHHPIDKKGKDSYIIRESGASYSVIQNNDFEIAIFIDLNAFNLEKFLLWLDNGPYNIDLVLTEGFRNFNNPTILCVSNLEDIKVQLMDNIKMISGVICLNDFNKKKFINLPIIDIQKNFLGFLEIFDIG